MHYFDQTHRLYVEQRLAGRRNELQEFFYWLGRSMSQDSMSDSSLGEKVSRDGLGGLGFLYPSYHNFTR